MYRYWEQHVKFIFNLLEPAPRLITEVGVYKGWNTKRLIEYLRELPPEGGPRQLTMIDPIIRPEIRSQERREPNLVTVLEGGSLLHLPRLPPQDVIILDGDHNYYTLLNELRIIDRLTKEGEPPLIFIHDTVENGFQDYYADPATIPEDYLNQAEPRVGWADRRYGPHNGLLMAIDDFMHDSWNDWHYTVIDRDWPGLGLLYTKKEDE